MSLGNIVIAPGEPTGGTITTVTTVTTLTTYTGNTPQTGDSFARIGAAGAGLTAVAIGTGGIAAASFAASAIDAAAIAANAIGASEIAADAIGASELAADAVAEIVAAVFAQAIEGTLTLLQAQRVQTAAAAGKTSGMDTGTGIIRDTTDAKDRVTATLDGAGNRTAITLDVS